MNDQEKINNQLIDQAIKELPLEPVPERVLLNIMGQIEAPSVVPQFQFSWIDFSFSAILAIFSGYLMLLVQNVNRSPYWSARIKIGSTLFWQNLKILLMQNRTDLLAGSISILTVISLLIILVYIYRRQISFERIVGA